MKNYDELTTTQDKIEFITNTEPFHQDGRPFEKERDLNLSLIALQELIPLEDEVFIYFIESLVTENNPMVNLEKLILVFDGAVSPEHFQKLIEASNPQVIENLPSAEYLIKHFKK